jgi:lysophospholipase L1-like esterase
VPVLGEAVGPRAGQVGNERAGAPPLRLLIAGDSSAAGVGVTHQDQALAGQLTRALAAATGARVHWRLVARSGLSTAGVLQLLRTADALPASDLAVVVSGVNDVLEQAPTRRVNETRAEMVRWLRDGLGVVHVAFAALPPMHDFPALPQPLRWIIGADARRHDRALAAWAGPRDDASYAPITIELGAPNMAEDGFHPAEPVYRACGEQIAAHLATRLAKGGSLPPPRKRASS